MKNSFKQLFAWVVLVGCCSFCKRGCLSCRADQLAAGGFHGGTRWVGAIMRPKGLSTDYKIALRNSGSLRNVDLGYASVVHRRRSRALSRRRRAPEFASRSLSGVPHARNQRNSRAVLSAAQPPRRPTKQSGRSGITVHNKSASALPAPNLRSHG